jgi:hypothetical protein
MRKAVYIILLLLDSFLTTGQSLDSVDSAAEKVVSEFIHFFKYNQKDEIIKRIIFPFERKYPLPDIKDEKEFLARYDEVFDDSLTRMIVNSNFSKQWSTAGGYRGIMFLNGLLWLDYEGGIEAVDESNIEKKKREELIKLEKDTLYRTIRNFVEPVMLFETSKYMIRIDYLGDYKYRYVSWPKTKHMSEKPDLIILRGEQIPVGSGRDITYRFKNGDYVYECSTNFTGPDDSPPASIEISKNGKKISSFDAQIIRN